MVVYKVDSPLFPSTGMFNNLNDIIKQWTTDGYRSKKVFSDQSVQINNLNKLIYLDEVTIDICGERILRFFKKEIKEKGIDKIYHFESKEELQNLIRTQGSLLPNLVNILGWVEMNIYTYLPILSLQGLNDLDYFERKFESEINKITQEIKEKREILNLKIEKEKNKFFNKLLKIEVFNKFSDEEESILQLKNNLEKTQKKLHTLKRIINGIKNYIDDFYSKLEIHLKNKSKFFKELKNNYNKLLDDGLEKYINFLIKDSWYWFEFEKNVKTQYNEENKELIIDYLLPKKVNIPNQVKNKKDELVIVSDSKFKTYYEEIIYSIVIRTLSEIFLIDDKKYISSVCFNGISKERSDSTGRIEEKYILSINVTREQIENLNLDYINPKECFKHLKGVSASKLYDLTEIKPIIIPKFADKRFIESKNIELENTPNLALMDWEDFEHLVRQIFEWEFSGNGGEVNVTQSSRDGGVDAIIFDPDPIKGGKIIIQAKRYTNTVGVSAVRDLYGTVINEGANKGILITTSDYGSDSYKFAQGKPITLLNGGHLLYLLEKHGKRAHINIEEAKKIQSGN